jgi:hypothetical protein
MKKSNSQREGHRLNIVQIPVFRLAGFSILILWALLYDLLVSPSFSWPSYLFFVSTMLLYCAASWRILRFGYGRIHPVDLGMVFLLLDLVMFLWVIYRTGADNSLLFFLMVLRVADQTYTSFGRVFFFAHVTTAAYNAPWTGLCSP